MSKYQFKILDKILSDELGINTLNKAYPFHKIHSLVQSEHVVFKSNISKHIIAKRKTFNENTIISEDICIKAYRCSR